MATNTVYLAGPITGLMYQEANSWRRDAIKYLENKGVTVYSPLRNSEILANLTTPLHAQGHNFVDQDNLLTQKATFHRDLFDVTRASVLFVNLLGAKIVSVGTVMEMAWAHVKGTPMIVAIEDENNIHEHIMLSYIMNFRTNDFNRALKMTLSVLGL